MGGALPDPEARSGRLPDFFIVGHQKCGTTALYLMLKGHPQIFMCPSKEPRFFAPDQTSRLRAGGSVKHPDTLEGYMRLFEEAAADQRAGEASPQYLRSQEAAANIAASCPQARIVAILREPASFLRSLHLQLVHNDQETETDLRRALELEPERRAGRMIPPHCRSPASLFYSEHVHYAEQLRRFHAAFPAEQVKVLIYDDFRADNAGVARELLRFLDVDADGPLGEVETDTLPAVRRPGLHRLAGGLRLARQNPAAAGLPLRVLNAALPRALRSDAMRTRFGRVVYGAPPSSDEQLMLELRRRFAGEVQAISEYLGRDLVALWGYDEDTNG
jgi:hypothetical protein